MASLIFPLPVPVFPAPIYRRAGISGKTRRSRFFPFREFREREHTTSAHQWRTWRSNNQNQHQPGENQP